MLYLGFISGLLRFFLFFFSRPPPPPPPPPSSSFSSSPSSSFFFVLFLPLLLLLLLSPPLPPSSSSSSFSSSPFFFFFFFFLVLFLVPSEVYSTAGPRITGFVSCHHTRRRNRKLSSKPVFQRPAMMKPTRGLTVIVFSTVSLPSYPSSIPPTLLPPLPFLLLPLLSSSSSSSPSNIPSVSFHGFLTVCCWRYSGAQACPGQCLDVN